MGICRREIAIETGIDIVVVTCAVAGISDACGEWTIPFGAFRRNLWPRELRLLRNAGVATQDNSRDKHQHTNQTHLLPPLLGRDRTGPRPLRRALPSIRSVHRRPEPYKCPADGYHTWEDEEIEQYRAHWPLGSEPRLVLEFAFETASRRCEVVHLGRQHVKAGRIKIARAKGCNGVDIPLSPELAAALAAMPATGLTSLVRPRGKPYTPAALGVKFAEWATEAGLPARCRLHGLRKARTAQFASQGASPHEIMSVTGHKSLAEVQRYADKFNRRKAADAAMARLLTKTAG